MGKMMKIALNKLMRSEKGQALPIVLILLLIGGLIIGSLLGFMSTGVKAGQVFEKKMDELYAADAGVEDALYNIITPTALHYADLEDLDRGEFHSYVLPNDVNNLPVTVTATKLGMLQGILDDSEYKIDQTHEGWIEFDTPIIVEETATYVKFYCEIAFEYIGVGSRQLQAIGAFFIPMVDSDLLDGPLDVVPMGAITFDDLKADSPETIFVPGGFAFIWRWEETPPRGPIFDSANSTGSIIFNFKVDNPGWRVSKNFAFATVKEEDISFVTSAPDMWRWQIDAAAGDTVITSYATVDVTQVGILTWEVDLQ